MLQQALWLSTTHKTADKPAEKELNVSSHDEGWDVRFTIFLNNAFARAERRKENRNFSLPTG